MGNLEKYLRIITRETSEDTSIVRTAQFLLEEKLAENVVLIAHHPHPNPFEILFNGSATFNLEQWKSSFLDKDIDIHFLSGSRLNSDEYIYFLSDDYRYRKGYLLLNRTKLSAAAKNILKAWYQLDQWTSKLQDQEYEHTQNQYANYISQIMHDSQSLIHLSQNADLTPELKQRLRYQERCNQDILFFIREPELFNIPVRPEHFISDSLDLIGINTSDLNIEIPKDMPEIMIDLELMSRVLNEIVKNAIEASNGKTSEITIELVTFPPQTPLHDYYWLQMTVRDKGCGIQSDFINQVVNPFFTTRKNEGATGFGLAVARKIVEAHHGYLEIHSEKNRGTKVSIFIPQDLL